MNNGDKILTGLGDQGYRLTNFDALYTKMISIDLYSINRIARFDFILIGKFCYFVYAFPNKGVFLNEQ